jgi:serine phosphatase RsbU (regulator of sigma subunit)
MTDRLTAENARLKRAVDELRVLNEISVTIAGAQGVEQITDSMVRKCVKHIRAEQGAIWLLDESENEIQARTHLRVMDNAVLNLPFKVGASLAGWILKHKRPLLVKDLPNDERFSEIVRDYSALRSLVAVPLSLKNKIVGFLCLFNSRTEGGFSNEDVRLLSIVAVQSVQTLENARLADEERRLLLLEEDLRVARHIQQSLLPKEPPKVDSLDIVGLSVAAQAVGGDYYDFIKLDRSRLGLAIADVSGKGTPAALLMANLQACLRSQAATDCSPGVAVPRTNGMFSGFLDPGRFITLFYGVLDLPTRTLTYVNAGHQYPIIIGKAGAIRELEGSDLIIGINAESEYHEEAVTLKAGDLMVLYTDGVTDARNSDGEMFGESRLFDLLKKNRQYDARTLSEKILDSINEFTGNAPQFDDITMMLVRFPD